MMAIPQVSLEEKKAPGALKGPGHCACVKDAHGHVALRALRALPGPGDLQGADVAALQSP